MKTTERASTASAITDEQMDAMFNYFSVNQLGARYIKVDRAQFPSFVRGLLALSPTATTAQPVGQDEPAPELCPHCDGTGEQTYMSDGGPDAYEQVGNCEHCGGAQTLAAAYVGVKNMLDRTEKSYREATAIIWHCDAGPTAAGRLENLAKYAKQPELASWLHDRLMALADMARVSPNAAAVEPSQPAPDFDLSMSRLIVRACTTSWEAGRAFEAKSPDWQQLNIAKQDAETKLRAASTPPAPAAPKKLQRIYEPDEKMTHYQPPPGLDQVTLCGMTDWIHQSQGQPTRRAVNCNSCNAIAAYFGYSDRAALAASTKGAQIDKLSKPSISGDVGPAPAGKDAP